MADIAITPANVAMVLPLEKVTLPAGEDIDAGQVVRLDTATGYAVLANATSAAEGRAIGVAVRSVVEGEAVTIVKRGLVDLGDALDAETIDEELSLSNTDGALDDGAGSPTTAVPIGRVWPAFGAVAADKLLFVDIAL